MVMVSLRIIGVVLTIIWIAIVGYGINWAESVRGKGPWLTWEQIPHVKWCERDRRLNLVREPSNAWSDVSYLALGLYMIYCGIMDTMYIGKENKMKTQHIFNHLTNFPLLSIVNGIANIIHAFGTWWNHSCRCTAGATLDIAGMLTVTTFPLLFSLFVSRSLSTKSRISPIPYILMLIFAFLTYTGIMLSGVMNDQRVEYAMTIVIALDLWALFSYHRISIANGIILRYNYLILTIVSLAIGLIFHRMDMAGILCFPDSLYQGHAVWHLATCITLWSVYSFFRTAQYSSKQS